MTCGHSQLVYTKEQCSTESSASRGVDPRGSGVRPLGNNLSWAHLFWTTCLFDFHYPGFLSRQFKSIRKFIKTTTEGRSGWSRVVSSILAAGRQYDTRRDCVGFWTHNRSFQRRVFPGNRLHWYRQATKNKETKVKRLKSGCLLQRCLQLTRVRLENSSALQYPNWQLIGKTKHYIHPKH